ERERWCAVCACVKVSLMACGVCVRKRPLGLPNGNPSVQSNSQVPEGIQATFMFVPGRGGTPTAPDLVNEFLAAKSAANSTMQRFNISTVDVCEIGVNIMSVTLFFPALSAFLGGLALWATFLIFALLFLGILLFWWLNRRSRHPFALLA